MAKMCWTSVVKMSFSVVTIELLAHWTQGVHWEHVGILGRSPF